MAGSDTCRNCGHPRSMHGITGSPCFDNSAGHLCSCSGFAPQETGR